MANGISYALDFERPILDLEKKISELKALSSRGNADFANEIAKLERKSKKLQSEIFNDLSRWQGVQLSRHPARPYFLDYVRMLFADFFELAGDRHFAEDPSLVGGVGRFGGPPGMLVAPPKGPKTKDD